MSLDREDILLELERRFGVDGSMIYLVDVIPLVAMMWADGHNQEPEIKLICDFIDEHRRRLREMAGGIEVVDDRTLRRFIARFVEQRPDKDLLRSLWELAHPLVLSHPDDDHNQAHAKRILDFCLDIAAACVVEYPYDDRARFLSAEKEALHALMTTLHIPDDRRLPGRMKGEPNGSPASRSASS